MGNSVQAAPAVLSPLEKMNVADEVLNDRFDKLKAHVKLVGPAFLNDRIPLSKKVQYLSGPPKFFRIDFPRELTPIMVAAHAGSLAMLEWLLKSGTNATELSQHEQELLLWFAINREAPLCAQMLAVLFAANRDFIATFTQLDSRNGLTGSVFATGEVEIMALLASPGVALLDFNGEYVWERFMWSPVRIGMPSDPSGGILRVFYDRCSYTDVLLLSAIFTAYLVAFPAAPGMPHIPAVLRDSSKVPREKQLERKLQMLSIAVESGGHLPFATADRCVRELATIVEKRCVFPKEHIMAFSADLAAFAAVRQTLQRAMQKRHAAVDACVDVVERECSFGREGQPGRGSLPRGLCRLILAYLADSPQQPARPVARLCTQDADVLNAHEAAVMAAGLFSSGGGGGGSESGSAADSKGS